MTEYCPGMQLTITAQATTIQTVTIQTATIQTVTTQTTMIQKITMTTTNDEYRREESQQKR